MNNAMLLDILNSMLQSTITDRFQTTFPLDVREVLKRQRVSFDVRPYGSAVIRPVPRLDDLFGSVRLNRQVASIREEKEVARAAVATQSYTAVLD